MSKISFFSDTVLSEISDLSPDVRGYYLQIVLLAHSNGGYLYTEKIASKLGIHTNKWQKILNELVENELVGVFLRETKKVLIPSHFSSQGKGRRRGVIGGNTREVIHIVTHGVTPQDTPWVSPIVTPPVCDEKPAENREKISSTYSNSISNNKISSYLPVSGEGEKPVESAPEEPPPDHALDGVPNNPDFARIDERMREKFPMLIGSGYAIDMWLKSGASVDLDILPTIDRLSEKGGVSSLIYISKAIASALYKRSEINKSFTEKPSFVANANFVPAKIPSAAPIFSKDERLRAIQEEYAKVYGDPDYISWISPLIANIVTESEGDVLVLLSPTRFIHEYITNHGYIDRLNQCLSRVSPEISVKNIKFFFVKEAEQKYSSLIK